MKQIEWNTTEKMWVWRIIGTPAYVPFQEGVLPLHVTQEDYDKAVEFMNNEDQKSF